MIAVVAPATWTALIASCEAAWPREACGWLSGTGAVATELRPARTGDRDGFAFADDDLAARVTAYHRGPAPRALYHSHPRGSTTLSAADLAALAPGGVVLHPLPHLVIAVRSGRATEATLYRWQDGAPVVTASVTRGVDQVWHPRGLAS